MHNDDIMGHMPTLDDEVMAEVHDYMMTGAGDASSDRKATIMNTACLIWLPKHLQHMVELKGTSIC